MGMKEERYIIYNGPPVDGNTHILVDPQLAQSDFMEMVLAVDYV